MKKNLVILAITAIVFGSYSFILIEYLSHNKKQLSQEELNQGLEPKPGQEPAERAEVLTLDPQKEKTHLSKVGKTGGVYWVRAFDMFWNEIEKEKENFDWSFPDQRIKEFNYMNIYPLVIVKPFTNWDQEDCHPEKNYIAEFDPMKGGKVKVGKPCDMEAYARFLEKAVERYDGDGNDDMPGLTIPVKYWEIMNEPSMQGGQTGGMGEELKFFVGTPQEYLEILKTSYQVIKKADPDAKVLHAGMAGMQQNFRDFWTPVFSEGGGDYFDIANIHTISTDGRREDLYMIKFKEFLEKYGIKDKPIWITEVQYGSLQKKPANIKDFETLMVKSSVLSLALGADKLFYIENWLHWNGEGKWEYIEENTESSVHKAYLNLVDKINNFDKVEKIKEELVENKGEPDGYTSRVGQYKFISGSYSFYVLWGRAELPDEIYGKIKITDIYGESKVIEANDLILSDEPLFVETIFES